MPATMHRRQADNVILLEWVQIHCFAPLNTCLTNNFVLVRPISKLFDPPVHEYRPLLPSYQIIRYEIQGMIDALHLAYLRKRPLAEILRDLATMGRRMISVG